MTEVKPIFMWTHPRSVSSAMERVMLQRGDLKTLHEPFLYLYYVGDARKPLAHFKPDPQHPTDYAGIRDMILSQRGPLFVKDMCYYISGYFDADARLQQGAVHTYLIRSPEKTVPSYHRLDPKVTRDEIGLDAVYRHFSTVAEATGAPPIVIDAADIIREPAAMVRAYCHALGLPFIAHSLHWDVGALPEAWRHVAGWHRDLAASRGLGEVNRRPAPPGDAPLLREWVDYHLPFYQRLREYRLPPMSAECAAS